MSANLRTQRVASSLYTQSLVWKSFRCTENILSKIKLKCVHLCVYQKARASKRWRAKHQRRENHVKMCILYMYFVLLLSSMGWYLRIKKNDAVFSLFLSKAITFPFAVVRLARRNTCCSHSSSFFSFCFFKTNFFLSCFFFLIKHLLIIIYYVIFNLYAIQEN